MEDVQIAGNATKKYTNLTFAGVEFTSAPVDASAMTHFHMDVYAPAGTQLAFKLVDFGPNGVSDWPQAGDDTEKELIFHAGTTPPFLTGQWVSLDIPLADFTGMNFGNVSQIVLTGANTGSLWLDNIYFGKN